MGLCSTQAKVEGILSKAAWHWGIYNSVKEQSPLRTRLHPVLCWPSFRVGLPGWWLYIFPHFVGRVLSGTLTDVNEYINHCLWGRPTHSIWVPLGNLVRASFTKWFVIWMKVALDYECLFWGSPEDTCRGS